MIDWLRPKDQTPPPVPTIAIAGHDLPIVIKRHNTAKRLIMRLARDGSEVRVTMPRWGQSVDAIEFVSSRAAWLESQLQGIEDINPPQPDGEILFCGDPLSIDWSPAAPRKPVLQGTRLRIGGPEETLQKRIERWLRGEALEMMAIDLAYYCEVAGVAKPDLKLSSAQRRWGSCSTSGTVRMNWRLIMAPEFVRRSVVAHEVTHLVHFDHSPAFHAMLGDIFEGEIDAANTWLKGKGRSLYGHFG